MSVKSQERRRGGQWSKARPSTSCNRIRSAARSIAVSALLCICVTAGAAEEKRAYHVTVGLMVLESESPIDGAGASEYVVQLAGNDPVLFARLQTAREIRNTLEKEIEKIEHRIMDPEADSAQSAAGNGKKRHEDELTSSHARLADVTSKWEAARDIVLELRGWLYGSTGTVSSTERRIHFADQKVGSLRIYEQDSLDVVVMQEDVFCDDLLGRKTIVIDAAMLKNGRFELSTGWIDSLHLGFVPVD